MDGAFLADAELDPKGTRNGHQHEGHVAQHLRPAHEEAEDEGQRGLRIPDPGRLRSTKFTRGSIRHELVAGRMSSSTPAGPWFCRFSFTFRSSTADAKRNHLPRLPHSELAHPREVRHHPTHKGPLIMAKKEMPCSSAGSSKNCCCVTCCGLSMRFANGRPRIKTRGTCRNRCSKRGDSTPISRFSAYSGDIVKGLAAGADVVMIGSLQSTALKCKLWARKSRQVARNSSGPRKKAARWRNRANFRGQLKPYPKLKTYAFAPPAVY